MTEQAEEIFSFGVWVRRRRKALDLTQAALAQRVACAEITIRKIEADAVRPSRDVAERLAASLAVPAELKDGFIAAARAERAVDRLGEPQVGTDVAPAATAPSRLPVLLLPHQLPADHVPDITPLPAGSRMPFAPNPLFVGRDADLLELAAQLAVGTPTVSIVTTGIGGIGKTQLATEFVHRYGAFFAGGVFWLSFAEAAGIATQVAACGGAGGLNLPAFDALAFPDQVARVRQVWQEAIPRLLIFDNCEDEALLVQWRPTTGGCRVLVTSRRPQWSASLGVRVQPVDVLPRADSIALLRTFRPDLPSDDACLNAIAAEVGDLPLALHLAGSYLQQYQYVITPTAYLAELRQPDVLAHRAFQVDGHSPTGHALHVARTFAVSIQRLDPTQLVDARALAVLARAACFAPGDPIPRHLLAATLAVEPLAFEDAVHRLVAVGLLENERAGALRMHRLVVAFARSSLDLTGAPEAVEDALIVVAEALAQRGDTWTMRAWVSHMHWVSAQAQHRTDARAAALDQQFSEYLNLMGAFQQAQRCCQRALAIRQQVLGPQHPATAESLNTLASLLRGQGDYAAARVHYEEVLAIREQALGPQHPDTAGSLNRLAWLLVRQGDYTTARPLLERALAIREQVLGPQHPDTATTLDTLAWLHEEQGDYVAARRLLERALAIRERALGPQHPDTAGSLNNLALLHQAQGDYLAARPLFERTIAIAEQALGPQHPDTAGSLANLASVLQAQGDYASAHPLAQRALTIHEQVLGPQHPATAESLNALAAVLQAQGDAAAARPLLARALAIREQALGTQHPDTADSLANLAALLQAQGDAAAARPLLARALAICEQALGPQHPQTQKIRDRLAGLIESPTAPA